VDPQIQEENLEFPNKSTLIKMRYNKTLNKKALHSTQETKKKTRMSKYTALLV